MTTILTTFAALCLVGASLLFLLYLSNCIIAVADRVVTVGYRVAEMKEDLEDRRVERDKK